MFVIGGFNGQQHLADVWALDLNTWCWSKMETQHRQQHRGGSTSPTPRRSAALVACGSSQLLLHGGYDGVDHLSDCYCLDLDSLTWSAVGFNSSSTTTRIITTSNYHSSASAPLARSLHTLTPLAGQRVVAIGGAGPLGTAARVQLLESPAVVQGAALRQELLAGQAEVAALQKRCALLSGQVLVGDARLLSANARVQALEQRCEAAQREAATAACSQEEVEQARSAEREAAGRAEGLELQVHALTRRLDRARAGGEQAVKAAQQLAQQLAAAEAEVVELRSQAAAVEQQLGDQSAAAAQAEERLAAVEQEMALMKASQQAEIARLAMEVERLHAALLLEATTSAAEQPANPPPADAQPSRHITNRAVQTAAHLVTGDDEAGQLQPASSTVAAAALQELAKLRCELLQERTAAQAARALAEDACLQLHVAQAQHVAEVEAIGAKAAQARFWG